MSSLSESRSITSEGDQEFFDSFSESEEVIDPDELIYFSEQWPMVRESYELLNQIGIGMNDNQVWHAKCIDNDHDIAIKIISITMMSPDERSTINNEMAGMHMMSMSDYVVSFYCSFLVDHKLWIVMELLVASVQDIIQWKYPTGIPEESVIATILSQSLIGIKHLHKNGVIHRDIKSANILMKDNGRVQITDFGVSAILRSREEKRYTVAGTWNWMAPEVLDSSEGGYSTEGGYSFPADIWSLGITAIEMAYGKPCYHNLNSEDQVILSILTKDAPTLTHPYIEEKKHTKRKFSNSFKLFVKSCLKKNYEKRSSASRLQRHKFFSKKKSASFLVKKCLDGLPSARERFRRVKEIIQRDLSDKFSEAADPKSRKGSTDKKKKYKTKEKEDENDKEDRDSMSWLSSDSDEILDNDQLY